MLKKFKIEKNEFLSRDIQGYYRYEHYPYRVTGELTYINILKNDFEDRTETQLKKAFDQLISNLQKEIINIIDGIIEGVFKNIDMVCVCVVPRSKAMKKLGTKQSYFFQAIQQVMRPFSHVSDGTAYIIRHKDTRKTHLDRSGYGGEGDMPYPGIAKDTCYFSSGVKGKHVLLIDDLYTKSVNVIEDMAQALLDHGATNVTVFAIGYTMLENSIATSEKIILKEIKDIFEEWEKAEEANK